MNKESATRSRDMTQGIIWKQLVTFALPLMLGNLFQQMYNTVDSIVVGRFVSTEALAAVGSTSSITNMLVGFFMGLSVGAGVVISQRFGAKDDEGVHRAVHTTVGMTIAIGLIFTVVGVTMAPIMLRLMKTPADVFPAAKTYLQIYFAGISGLVLYNMGSGILRAVGDSRRPLYFLVFCSVINTVLDLVFVLVLHMGVEGVAYATVLAQFLSAGLILLVLSRSEENYRFIPQKLRIYPTVLKNIFNIGLPSALQRTLTAFSNVFVQGYVNDFGADCMAGWGCYHRLDQFILLPMQSVTMGGTTFVGQNIGARNLKRAEKGVSTAIWLSVGVTAALIALLNLFCMPALRIFSEKTGVLEYGRLFIRLNSPFYVICCLNQVYSGALRGAGDSKAPMAIMLFSFVFFRQIYLYVGSLFIHDVRFVALGYPLGWLVCSVLQYLYYKKSHWRQRCMAQWAQEDAAGRQTAA